jgi:signal transduction histidine kinase
MVLMSRHIFDRFYRGQRVDGSNIPGTGLGLALGKGIVDLHGDRIIVESQLGEAAGSEYGCR